MLVSSDNDLAQCHWIQLGNDIGGESGGDKFGYSISLSSDGKTLAVGARVNDGNGLSSGHVRVYKVDSYNNWIQVGNDIDGAMVEEFSGWSVSLPSDGNTLAVGAPRNDGNGEHSGHVRVYKVDSSNNWIKVGNDIDGEKAGDYSGESVSLSSDGKTLAVGAPRNDGNGNNSGHVKIYKVDSSNNWIQVGNDIDGEKAGDYSGESVSLSSDGKTLAVGASNNDANGYYSGHVRVYQVVDSSNIWIQLGNDIDGEKAGDDSGDSVSLSSDGMTVAVGATWNDDNGFFSGHVRVYKVDSSNNWIQVGNDIDGERAGDLSGYSVSLSSDGTTVAVGAPGEYDNEDRSGHVRVYKVDSSNNWIKVGNDIDGEKSGDWSGRSVSLSSDGMTVAVGAPLNDGNGDKSGHVRVYQLVCTTQLPSTHPSASPTTSPSTHPSISPTISTSPSTHPSISPTVSPSTSSFTSPSTHPSTSPTTSPNEALGRTVNVWRISFFIFFAFVFSMVME